MYNETQIDNAMQQWMLRRRFSPDPTTNAKIRQRVLDLLETYGGQVSATHFERAALELMNEGEIKPFRGTAAEHESAPAIPADVVRFIETASSFELRRKYSNDKGFRRQYDTYAAAEIRKKAQEEQNGFVLTVEEYKSLPAQTLIRNYRSSPQWKRAIDDLVAKGLI